MSVQMAALSGLLLKHAANGKELEESVGGEREGGRCGVVAACICADEMTAPKQAHSVFVGGLTPPAR